MKKLFLVPAVTFVMLSLSFAAACGDDDDDDDDDGGDDDDDDAEGIDCEGACVKVMDCVEEELYDLGALRSMAEQECVSLCEDEGTQEIYDCVMNSGCETLVEDACGLPIDDYLV